MENSTYSTDKITAKTSDTPITSDITADATTNVNSGSTTGGVLVDSSKPAGHHNNSSHLQSGFWTIRNMAIIAMLSSLSLALSYIAIPIMPAAPFLKYDPSGVIAIIAGLAFGLQAAVSVSILGFIYHVFIDPLGGTLAIVITLVLSVTVTLIAHKKPTVLRIVLGLLLGSILTLGVAILGNLLITPIYAHVSVETVIGMIIPILIPFNLLKFALHSALSLAIYRSALTIMARRTNHA